MSKIPVEQLVERSIGLFKRYKPALEDLFAVNLDGLNIKGHETLLEDALHCFRYLQEKFGDDEESYRRSVTKEITRIMRNDYAIYLVPTNTIYIVSTSPKPDKNVRTSLVHEVSHVIHQKLIDDGRAKEVDSRTLRTIVSDGFAEYVALKAFAPHYTLPGIEKHLRKKRLRHEMGFADYVMFKDKLFMSQGDLDFEGELRYSAGYIFFKRATEEGVLVSDVLRDPPEDVESIIDPTEYLKEMSS